MAICPENCTGSSSNESLGREEMLNALEQRSGNYALITVFVGPMNSELTLQIIICNQFDVSEH